MKESDKIKLLPENAKKVFTGIIHDVYQWPQKMFDGSTKMFEKLIRPDTVIIMSVHNNKFILNNEKQPGHVNQIDFQMGRVDKGETSEIAALRELKEESGITPEKLFFISTEKPPGKVIKFDHYFLAFGIKERVGLNPDTGEKIENLEFSFDEIYEKFSDLKLDTPRSLIKVLIKESKEKFLDRFIHPEKYFEEIQM